MLLFTSAVRMAREICVIIRNYNSCKWTGFLNDLFIKDVGVSGSIFWSMRPGLDALI